jgi:hypothetical protein
MSGWTPSPPDPGGTPADPRTGYGYGNPPPEPDDEYPVPRRNRALTWIGIITGIVVIAALVAGTSIYILGRSKKWTLTAPQTVAGMSRGNTSLDQFSFSSVVARFRSDVTSLRNFGSLNSTVSALYTLNQDQAVGFIGFNGTFNVRVALTTGSNLKVSAAHPGPHGGTAECGTTGTDAVCQWSTGTTVGIVLVIPTNPAAGEISTATANNLMIKIRDSAERSVHGS